MIDPMVSIIIPAYNVGEYIDQCILSVINQTYQNLEIIVVYSPSSDNTAAKLWKYCDHDNIRLEVLPKSTCSKARNRGVALSHGKYIAMLDGDDWWEHNKLEQMVMVMEKDGDLEWASHYLLIHFIDRTALDNTYPGHSYSIGGTGTILFRRSLLDWVKQHRGYIFNPNMDRNDDADLVLYIRNHKSVLIPEYLSHYRMHENNLTTNTTDWQRLKIIIGMGIRNHAYNIVAFHVGNFILSRVSNTILGCDLVTFKKRWFE